MTKTEREAFLSAPHVGVISIERKDAAPLSTPIWYDYAPDTGVWIITGGESDKGRLLREAGRFSLVAQSTDPERYQYVSIEGPILETREPDLERDRRPMAHRYLGAEMGNAYLAATQDESLVLFVMRPKRWRTVDYGKSPLRS